MLSPLEALQLGADLRDHPEAALAQPTLATTIRYVRIGHYGLMLEHRMAGEILEPMPPLHRIPGGSRGLAGAVNVRGSVVPVFDLHGCLGVSQEHVRRNTLFVYGQGDAMAAFFIDQLPVRMHSDALSAQANVYPPAFIAACVRQSFLIDDLVLFDLDMAQMFAGHLTPTQDC
jgi:chemotaxis signal transduction protein